MYPLQGNLTQTNHPIAETETESTTEQQVETGKASEKPVIETVNINTADASTRARLLNGIGLKKADAIVAHQGIGQTKPPIPKA